MPHLAVLLSVAFALPGGQGSLVVDLSDFAELKRCFGPLPDAMCRIAFDCDNANGEIDLDDYAVFQAKFSGQVAPPCGKVLVPGGEFEMGCHVETGEICRVDELPVHTVYIDSFFMDVYEVPTRSMSMP